MAARKKGQQINLLPQEEFTASTLGRILTWLLSTFRVIVIVTEIVVMLAFLSRFWLDARSTDLNDLIKQKQVLIEAASDFEKEFRATQKRLEIFKELSSDESIAAALSTVSSYLPPGVILSSFSFSQDGFLVRGFSPDEVSIAQFISNLEGSEGFGEISITQVSSAEETANLLIFSLSVKPKGKGES